MRSPVKLLVIDPRTGMINRHVDRKLTNIVHADEPELLGNILPALELFRLHGPIQPTPPRTAA